MRSAVWWPSASKKTICIRFLNYEHPRVHKYTKLLQLFKTIRSLFIFAINSFAVRLGLALSHLPLLQIPHISSKQITC